MADYNVIVKRIRGVNNAATDLLVQNYIESIDSGTQGVLYMNYVGDNNYYTCFITHTHDA
jgi:hypothetical protein